MKSKNNLHFSLFVLIVFNCVYSYGQFQCYVEDDASLLYSFDTNGGNQLKDIPGELGACEEGPAIRSGYTKPSWITNISLSGGNLSVTCSENTGTSNRNDIVYITLYDDLLGDIGEIEILVNQSASVYYYWYNDADGDGKGSGTAQVNTTGTRPTGTNGNPKVSNDDDSCPNEYGSTSNGCPEIRACSIDFDDIDTDWDYNYLGGTITRSFTIEDGNCVSPDVVFGNRDNFPDWVESASINMSNKTITVEVDRHIIYEGEDDDDRYFQIQVIFQIDGQDDSTAGIFIVQNSKTYYNWYLDYDQDGYADSILQAPATPSPGTGYTRTVLPLGDCSDDDPSVHEVTTWYLDSDGDGYSISSVQSCGSPGAGYVLTVTGTTDCDGDQIFNEENDCSVPSDLDPLDQNYVYTRTYQEKRSDVPDRKFDENGDGQFDLENDYIQQITYFDGLGRPMQQNAIRHSPRGKDIVTHVGYDDYGRMDKEWLPIPDLVTNSPIGTFRTIDMEAATRDYYKNNSTYSNDFATVSGTDVNAFSEKYFEKSPLNRVLKQAAPGEDWALNENGDDHSIEFAYETNEANEVRLFNVNFVSGNIEQPELTVDNFYEAGQLYKNITRDENHSGTTKNHTTEEFTDKQGRVVLKRTYANVPAIDLNNDGDMDDLGEQARLEAPHDTYYVYDDYGNLTFVLPPKMEATEAGLSTLISNMDALGYQYNYDHRNRLVEKQIPGKDEEYIVYNKLDQPILTQDANLRKNGQWLFTKYDAFGRVAYTGIATLGSLATVKTGVESSSEPLWVTQTGTSTSFGEVTDGVFYTSNTYPNTNTEILTINYYDNYDARPTSFPTSVSLLDSESNDNNTINVKGLPTVSKFKVLENDAWITSLSYYDEKGRAVYSYSENSYLNTVDITETALDFVGKPLKTRTEHRRDLDPAVSGDEVIVVTIDNFTYDHVGRLLSQTQCIGEESMGDSCDGTGETTIEENLVISSGTISTDKVASKSITITDATIQPISHIYISTSSGNGGAEELITFNDYDELGQLIAKKVGGTPANSYEMVQALQTIDYTYNIRGWLKQINDPANIGTDLFAFKLNYNTADHGATKLYNGNIAETEWRTANTDKNLKWYAYGYDPLNRITAATGNTSNYNLSNVSYDKMGNITLLNRNGHTNTGATTFGVMDNLVYTYDSGNKLTKVLDNGNDTFGFKDSSTNNQDYWYDLNGNMTRDLNKGIGTTSANGITYNHLNLPTEVKFNTSNTEKINYIYDAVGTKQKKIVTNGGSLTTTEYAGNYIYEGSTLQFFNHGEGYSTPNGLGGYDYIYQFKDHLGNIRLSYTDNNGTLEIVKESNYYPFGLQQKGYNESVSPLGNAMAKKYMFSGKEYQDDNVGGTQLNWYDITARNYDPALGRWMNLDPLAEQMRRHSPYNYAFDNPIYFMDPDGMAPLSNNCCGESDGEVPLTYQQSLQTAVVRKATGLWNTAKAFATNPISTAINTVKAIGSSKNLAEGVRAARSGDIAGVGSAINNSIDSSISQIAAEEGLSRGNATRVMGSGIAVDVMLGLVTDGLASGLSKSTGVVDDVLSISNSKTNNIVPELKIEIPGVNKIDRNLLDPPKNTGNAPTFKSDGTSVEIHHLNQNPNGPFIEMHWFDHRGKGNYSKNHPQGQTPLNKSQRKEFNNARNNYWIREYE